MITPIKQTYKWEKFKEINIKNQKHYFFNDMTNIKIFTQTY